MKTLVVYFSRSGHTEQVAGEIARRCSADLETIREARDRTGVWGYCRAAWDALVRAAPPVLAPVRDPAQYDLVVIGTPIWNFQLAPPVRSYAKQQAARFKQVAFFCTEGGSGDKNAFDELSRICGKSPISTMVVTESQLPEPAHSQRLQGFVAQLVPGHG